VLPGNLPPRVVGFLEAVRRWASARPDILAVALVGSYARGAATDSSDVDLVLLTEEPESYFVDTAWVGVFGDIRCQQAEDWGKVTSLRVWYRDGLEVEFGITRPDWATPPLDDGTREVVEAGLVVLHDVQGCLSHIS
jgi:predicted nucleotidyltransferase